MNIELNWTSAGLILSVVIHAVTTIRASAKLEAKVETMTQSLSRIDKELEKRDAQMTSMWKRIDELRDMIGK